MLKLPLTVSDSRNDVAHCIYIHASIQILKNVYRSLFQDDNHQLVDFVSYVIYYPVVLAVLFLNCFADARPIVQTYPVDKVTARVKVLNDDIVGRNASRLLMLERVPGKSIVLPVANILRLVRFVRVERLQAAADGRRPVESRVRTELGADSAEIRVEMVSGSEPSEKVRTRVRTRKLWTFCAY